MVRYEHLNLTVKIADAVIINHLIRYFPLHQGIFLVTDEIYFFFEPSLTCLILFCIEITVEHG